MPPVFAPFLLGLVFTPLAKRLVKPLVRGTVKTSMSLVMELKKAAHEAGEELHDMTAEVAAELIGAELREEETVVGKPVKPRSPADSGTAAGKGR